MIVDDLIRSFAGGEITPELFGRLDLTKYQTGLRTCRNFRTLPHGPAENRAGFQYINEIRDSTKAVRIIPFTFNVSQTYILELGEGYIRFHTNAATLLDTAQAITGITQANPGVLTYVGADPVNGKWVYLAGIGGMTELNGRYVVVANVNAGANTFELHDTAGNNINTTTYGAYTAGGTMSPVYEITSTYLATDLFDLDFEQNADVVTIVHPSYAPMELKRVGATNWTLGAVSFAPAIATPGVPTVTATGAGAIGYTYVTTALAADGLEESYASGNNGVTNDLTIAGHANNITPAAVAGAVRYNIYKINTGGIYGYIGQSVGTVFIDDNITPDTTRTPPQASTPFTGADNYPSAVSYFEQRRCFGGSNNRPQNLWLTRSATESNLSYSIPTQDDDAIVAKIVTRQVNRIRHIVPLLDLIVLTAGAEIKVYSQNSDALTPNTIANRPQSYVGASGVRPVVTNASILYIQALGSRMRELVYSWQSAKYESNDASLLATHLFDGYTITDLTYSRAPTQTAWLVRDDGLLLGVTYVPEQQVLGWHHHDTDGLFKSVACVAEGNEDVLYAAIERTINGRTVKYLERQHTRLFSTQADAFFVDAGLTYSGAPTKVFSGLWHLEGKTVSILGDGAVFPRQVVTNGRVTLTQNVSKASIGLPYTSDLETLPIALEAEAGGLGNLKNVNQVSIRVNKSSGIFVGPDENNLTQIPPRTTEAWGTPPALRSEMLTLNILPDWNDDGGVFVRQTDPLPLSVLALVLNTALGD